MSISRVDQLDQLIVADPKFDTDWFKLMQAAQRELGLVHGQRPTCPFLRPQIITRDQYEAVRVASELIASAFEVLVETALQDPSLLELFGLNPREEEMAKIHPGYERLCVTSRLDCSITTNGFKFLEYNAESPAGVGDQMQLEQVLLRIPQTVDFLKNNPSWLPMPHQELLNSLVAAYRESGGEREHPQIAIVDWEGVATAAEFAVLRDYFQLNGNLTVIADPRELHYDGNTLSVGEFRVDIVYKRVVIHEFLERCGSDHPLVQAYRDGRVCMANSFRSKIAHKKAGFAVLSDPRYEHLFTPEEIDVFRRHIPWTRRVETGTTTIDDKECDLLSLIREERERFVLKPNDDYGGHGVVLGWETSAGDWEQAIAVALKRPHVVQERVELEKTRIPVFSDRVKLEEMYVDFNPFLFNNKVEGALIRLSASSLLNVTSGGGQTALLVLED
ncbi:MAG TPA: circularly permuted type 2 ATP-grasp protein [Pyrinomonadaceae bacterium]